MKHFRKVPGRIPSGSSRTSKKFIGIYENLRENFGEVLRSLQEGSKSEVPEQYHRTSRCSSDEVQQSFELNCSFSQTSEKLQ